MEIMEAREELEEAESAETVDAIRHRNAGMSGHSGRDCYNPRLTPAAEKVEETIQQIRDALSADPPDFESAKTLAVQLKYWQGLENAAKEWSPKIAL